MGSRPPRLPHRRIAADALRTVRSRPGRTIGLGLAIALGVATAVGILSLSDAANTHTRNRIDANRPEVVRVRPVESAQAISDDLPDTALDHAADDDRVHAVASVQSLPEVSITTRPTSAPAPAVVIAVDGDLASATRATITGRQFTDDENRATARVAIVGARIANTIHLGPIEDEPAIWIDGIAFRVIGIAQRSEHLGSITEAVLIPRDTAITYLGDSQLSVDSVLYARTSRGAADATAAELPLRITPNRPEGWTTEVPRINLELATLISNDLRSLTLAMAGVVLLVGVIAIANAMTRAVYERVPEIGLRRALGAHRHQILLLLLAEASLIGTAAGIIGLALGSAAAVAIAAHNHWPIAISTIGILLAVPVALCAGAIGGLIPSIAAIRVTPSQALRRE
jgi:ABC-type lipoprotein release transport system permease subunit